jgi:hypothetical protein
MIHYGLQDGRYVVRKGSTITLECRATGNPRPTISWRKKVRNGTSKYSMKSNKEAFFVLYQQSKLMAILITYSTFYVYFFTESSSFFRYFFTSPALMTTMVPTNC